MNRLNKNLSIYIIVLLVLSIFASSGFTSSGTSYAASIKKPKYIAHRGLSAKAPENTLAAFSLAAKEKGFYGVEFDVWESLADNPPEDMPAGEEEISDEQQETYVNWTPLILVMHDQSTERMCGIDTDIQSISRSDLNDYSIISGKNVDKYSGQKIPTVEQALDTIYKDSKGAIPVIELKHRLSPRAMEYLMTVIGRRKAVIISFDFNAVKDAEKMAATMGVSKKIKTMYLRSKLSQRKYSSTIRKMKKAGIDCISLNYKATSSKTIRKFHKSGLKVCVWSLPNKKTARKFAKMGVDYITSDGKVF